MARDRGLLVYRDGILDVEGTKKAILATDGELRGSQDDVTDYSQEMRRVRLVQAKLAAELARIERDEKLRRLLPRDEVARVFAGAIATLRERLLSLPARLAGGDAGRQRMLDAEIRETLDAAADAIEAL